MISKDVTHPLLKRISKKHACEIISENYFTRLPVCVITTKYYYVQCVSSPYLLPSSSSRFSEEDVLNMFKQADVRFVFMI